MKDSELNPINVVKDLRCTVFISPRKIEDVLISSTEISQFLAKNHVLFVEPSICEPIDKYLIMFYIGSTVIPSVFCLRPGLDISELTPQIDAFINHWSVSLNVSVEHCYSVIIYSSTKKNCCVWKPYRLAQL